MTKLKLVCFWKDELFNCIRTLLQASNIIRILKKAKIFSQTIIDFYLVTLILLFCNLINYYLGGEFNEEDLYKKERRKIEPQESERKKER